MIGDNLKKILSDISLNDNKKRLKALEEYYESLKRDKSALKKNSHRVHNIFNICAASGAVCALISAIILVAFPPAEIIAGVILVISCIAMVAKYAGSALYDKYMHSKFESNKDGTNEVEEEIKNVNNKIHEQERKESKASHDHLNHKWKEMIESRGGHHHESHIDHLNDEEEGDGIKR